MNQYPSLRRFVAGTVALTIMGVVVVIAATSNRPAEEQPSKHDPQYPWPMWGGGLTRNQVNLFDKNTPLKWDVDKNINVLWAEDLGSKAYGGPVIGDGKIFI